MPGQYVPIWTTPGGGTGFSVLHFDIATSGATAQIAANHCRTFYDAIKSVIPNDVTFSFPSEWRDLDDAGNLLQIRPITPPASVVGTVATGFSRAAGARIDWATGAVVGGRLLRGRTYIVPIGASSFDIDGLLGSATILQLKTAADALISNNAVGLPLKVWSRKHVQSVSVTGSSVPTKGAILRGRRD